MLDGKCCAYFVHSNFKVYNGTLAVKQLAALKAFFESLDTVGAGDAWRYYKRRAEDFSL